MKRILTTLVFSTICLISFSQDNTDTKVQKAKTNVKKTANEVKGKAEKHTDTLAQAIDRTGSKAKKEVKKAGNEVAGAAKTVGKETKSAAKKADKKTDSLVKQIVPGAHKVNK